MEFKEDNYVVDSSSDLGPGRTYVCGKDMGTGYMEDDTKETAAEESIESAYTEKMEHSMMTYEPMTDKMAKE